MNKIPTMTEKQIKARRLELENQIQQAQKTKTIALHELRELCRQCKHDGTATWEQSASGNESYYICDICGAEMPTIPTPHNL